MRLEANDGIARAFPKVPVRAMSRELLKGIENVICPLSKVVYKSKIAGTSKKDGFKRFSLVPGATLGGKKGSQRLDARDAWPTSPRISSVQD